MKRSAIATDSLNDVAGGRSSDPLTQHLIISPHLDDAWFDLGGSINEWRKAGNAVKVIDVFSIHSWTKDNSLPVEQVTRIRKLEETANARRDGVALKFLDLPEGPLRGYDLIFPQEINWSIDATTLDIIVASLRDSGCLQRAGSVYFPLGIGGHVDHLLIREAFTILATNFLVRSIEIGFYEDLPYASYGQLPFDFISHHRLSPVLQEIDLAHKITSVRTYKSQIDDDTEASIKNHAYVPGGRGQAYERLWMLNRPPRDPYQIAVL